MANSLSPWRRLRSVVDVPPSFVSRDTCLPGIKSPPSNCLRDAVKDDCPRLSRRRRPKWIANLDAVCGHCGGYPDDARFAGKDVRGGGSGGASRQQPRSPGPYRELCSCRLVDRPLRTWDRVDGWLPNLRCHHLSSVHRCYV